MKVEVRLFAHLRKKLPNTNGLLYVKLEQGDNIQNLIKKLSLENESSLIIMVNGRRQLDDFILKDGDRVGIFPPVGGG